MATASFCCDIPDVQSETPAIPSREGLSRALWGVNERAGNVTKSQSRPFPHRPGSGLSQSLSLFPDGNINQMRNNELQSCVAMTTEGVYVCFMNVCTTRCRLLLPIFESVNCLFPSSPRNVTALRSSCQRRTAAITARKVRMPKWKSGFIHMVHVRLTPHWRRDLHIKHRSAAIRPRSQTRLTFHAKLSVGGVNAHLRSC